MAIWLITKPASTDFLIDFAIESLVSVSFAFIVYLPLFMVYELLEKLLKLAPSMALCS